MKSVRSFVLLTVLTLLSAPAGIAQEKTTEQLGKVNFPVSCSPKAQAQFERGVAMLHSYWFTEGGKVFEAIVREEPSCVMAYWGLAVNLLGNSLVGPPPAKDAQKAWEVLDKAKGEAKTERERDWIEALSAYYRDHDKVSVDDRLLAYTKAMEQLTQRYPDDFEAWAYYALTLQASAPKTDKIYSNQQKSAAILEKLYKQNPQHPGVSHYLIHAYDYPPLADKGIESARRYAGIAPAAPHARHMPSHIYSMVGLWEESIASNRSALQVQKDYYHATDFMVYAHLQLAQDAKAKALIDEIYKIGRDDLLNKDNIGGTLGVYTALAVIPARYALERGDWKEAAALPAVPSKRLMAESLIRFTRGLGMARSGDVAGAKREIEEIQGIQKELLKAKDPYWAARSEEQIQAVSAWVAFSEGSREQAVKLMRSAADGEDGSVKNVAMENRLYPMRELFAELLLESGQAAPALREFEAALKENPNRYRGLYGAARAAEAAGDQEKAASYFAKLVTLSKNADTDRPEIAQAKTFLAKK